MRPTDLIDTHLLQTFVVISESQSLTDASRRLGVTQSAVSQSLKQLETSVGVELVARRTTPVQLTHAGLTLKQQADVILGELRRLAVNTRAAADKGLVNCRIGLVSSMSEVFGVTLIKSLDDRAERIQLRSGTTPTLARAFMNREIDILISDTALSELEGLERYLLFRDPMLMAVARSVVSKQNANPESIANTVPMIKYDRNAHIGTYTEMAMRRMRLLSGVRTETDDTHTLMRFVTEGEGWAVLSALCLAQAGADVERVSVLPLDRSRHARYLYLLAREDELGQVPTVLANAIRERFEVQVLPALQDAAPWLEAGLFKSVS